MSEFVFPSQEVHSMIFEYLLTPGFKCYHSTVVACYSIVAFRGYLCLAKRCIIWSDIYQETRTLWNQEDNNISKATITPIMPPFLSQSDSFIYYLGLTLLDSLIQPQWTSTHKNQENPLKP